MTALKITDVDARKIFNDTNTPAYLKSILESSYPGNFFSQKITDRVKTFEDACKELSIDSISVFNLNDSSDEIAYKKLKIIVQVLNEGWVPDWNDEDQYKYYPWFYMNVASGFQFDDVVYDFTLSIVGSRLCFKSSELANYAAKQFVAIYKDFFTL